MHTSLHITIYQIEIRKNADSKILTAKENKLSDTKTKKKVIFGRATFAKEKEIEDGEFERRKPSGGI